LCAGGFALGELRRSTASLAVDEIEFEAKNNRMSLFTHWACFNCRKSFHRSPLENQPASEPTQERKCPDCTKPTVDMGVYFEPPPRRATKQWATMQLLAENGFKFQTEGSKAYIESFVLRTKRPRVSDVRETIAAEKQAREAHRTEHRLKLQKEEKAQRKRLRKIENA
jgi:hypothetical protein